MEQDTQESEVCGIDLSLQWEQEEPFVLMFVLPDVS